MKKWLFGIPLGVLLLLAIYGASQMKSTPTGQQRYDLYFLSDSYTSGSALDTESCTLDSEKDVVNQLVHALLSKPKRSELTSAQGRRVDVELFQRIRRLDRGETDAG